ncbi:hypothetical protein QAD02_016226 [Eretmocerus hayati]|uniref:Uncharacterized protein n=1 Tax=Eretmocerus hayati TaxID=131215 RepID=A0ACC2PA06_9HYME|nr:hypothetical protein QAD02_016226 [Eretmocerus hayati]
MQENIDEQLSLRKKEKASDEHKHLANFIKEVHAQLRDESQKLGADKAWSKHISQEEKLKNYADYMYKLATEHWAEKKGPSLSSQCRIEWIKGQIKHYFTSEGFVKWDDKEKYLLRSINQCSMEGTPAMNIKTEIEPPLNILDVGSCYNPFKTDDTFNVTAIDIAPYSEDVTKCDFLKLEVQNTKEYSRDDEALIMLPESSFDAVIFSLFLEYIPCPNQRFLCCEKAYNLLRKGGILLIATPDSKNGGANIRIINTSWKVTLAKLGFMRIQYKKLAHLHCLVFRKCFNKQSASLLIKWEKIPNNDVLFTNSKIFIPQDFSKKKLEANSELLSNCVCNYDSQDLADNFDELPFADV